MKIYHRYTKELLLEVKNLEIDLYGANLSGADLSGINFNGAYLNGVNLNGTDLSWANLRGTDLSKADLSGADLRWAIGNGKEVKSYNIGNHPIVTTKDNIFIGCKVFNRKDIVKVKYKDVNSLISKDEYSKLRKAVKHILKMEDYYESKTKG